MLMHFAQNTRKKKPQTPLDEFCSEYKEEEAANAALIAAAPYLYEAIKGAEVMLLEAEKQFRQHGDNGHANMCALHAKQAKEALAKARNEILP